MPATALDNSAPLVAIDSGRISGSHFGSSAHQVMFLGIPYAAPPTGDRRWKPPDPVEPWKGVRRADAFAPACPQPVNSVRAQAAEAKELSQKLPYYRDFQTDEDCLYLNIWTTNLAGKQKLPVMVSIHGGGGFSGNSWTVLGPSLAPNGVVLVSVGFRIGALGHLAHPLLTEESPITRPEITDLSIRSPRSTGYKEISPRLAVIQATLRSSVDPMVRKKFAG
jgi:para-nitrobenzyl esterase